MGLTRKRKARGCPMEVPQELGGLIEVPRKYLGNPIERKKCDPSPMDVERRKHHGSTTAVPYDGSTTKKSRVSDTTVP